MIQPFDQPIVADEEEDEAPLRESKLRARERAQSLALGWIECGGVHSAMGHGQLRFWHAVKMGQVASQQTRLGYDALQLRRLIEMPLHPRHDPRVRPAVPQLQPVHHTRRARPMLSGTEEIQLPSLAEPSCGNADLPAIRSRGVNAVVGAMPPLSQPDGE